MSERGGESARTLRLPVIPEVRAGQAEEQGYLKGAVPLGRLAEGDLRETSSYSRSTLGL